MSTRTAALAAVAVASGGWLLWHLLTVHPALASSGPIRLGPGAVVTDSAVLVFREGLECILVLAAVTASFTGANRTQRRPVAGGAAIGMVATLATWFVAIAVIGAVGGASLDVQAATGLLAVVVLLVVMNWFFHRIYWTGWIASHHKRRKRLLAGDGTISRRRIVAGLALLGFSSVYREGFEVVLFLQNLRIQYGSAVVAEGAVIGLAFTAAVGVATFGLARKLPYKRMLVATGIILGVVLVVMVGESAQELQLAGWLPATQLPLAIPRWMGPWLAVFPTVESLAAQVVAALLVIGSYVVAEEVRVKRVRRRRKNLAIDASAPARHRP